MCHCDFEYPSFYSVTEPKARKQHKCCECRQTIEPGQHYVKATGCWDGSVSTFKTCTDCWQLIDFIQRQYKDSCFSHGQLKQELYNLDLIFSDDDFYENDPKVSVVGRSCPIVASVPWLKCVQGVWRLDEQYQQKAAA